MCLASILPPPAIVSATLPLCSGKEMASKDHLEDVKREVLVVSELMEILSGEQKYLQRKLERHILTVVSGTCGWCCVVRQ